MPTDTIRERVREFIRTNFLYDPNAELDDAASLLERGVIDSTGVLELITFLETEYGLTFADDQLVAENFDSVDRITAFMGRLTS